MNINLPSEVVRRVVRENLDATEAMQILERLTKVREAASNRRVKIRQIQSDADRKIRELEAQDICQHEYTTTHGDPSGNGDSEKECLICGEWIGR